MVELEAKPTARRAREEDLAAAFLRAVAAAPDRPAIIENGHALSYGEVWRRAGELAADLGPACGVVGVEASRSANTIIALLGTLLAGGAYCPIDPAFPAPRQRTIARVAGCRVAVATRGAAAELPGLRAIDLRAHAPAPSVSSTRPAAADLERAAAHAPEAPAYILFTSGSTGEPKPVVTPRRAIAAAVGSLRDLLEIAPSDRVLQLASLNWDTCFEEILPALTAGAAVVIDDDAYAGSLPRVLRLISRAGLTVIDLPTALWHELVDHLAEGQLPLPAPLRVVVIGGEAARPRRLAEWRALDTAHVRLVNTYGCTETTLVTHAIDLHGPRAASAPGPWTAASEVPIGRAMPHVLEHIDANGQLLIGGPALALGYLDAPVATASRFRTQEDGGGGPRRYFLTGDRVARLPTGALVHRGRLDSQIKVRGIRIDPGEVESEIACHAGVAAVAVVGVTVADHTALVAYVVPRPAAAADTLPTELTAFLRARVPAHLIPSQLAVVPELVHTPSGKVDRAASHQRYAPRTGPRRAVP